MLAHFNYIKLTLMEVIYFLLHLLKDPLTTLQDFLAHYEMLTYVILAAIIFVETGLIVMPLLPGDSLLFAVGLLASSTGKLDIQIVIPLLIGAALLGDNVNHFVGKHFSKFVKSRDQILFFKHEYLSQTEAFYEKHGGKAVIMARFVPIIRTIAPFVAGHVRAVGLLNDGAHTCQTGHARTCGVNLQPRVACRRIRRNDGCHHLRRAI